MTDTNKRELPASYRALPFPDALEELTVQAERMNPTAVFLVAVWQEIERARLMFPESDGVMAALAEETGELAKAVLGQPLDRVYKEAIQAACVACRIATEGDPTLDPTRRANGLEPTCKTRK